jgi:hypothetical protein
MSQTSSTSRLSVEFQSADFGDARLTKRLMLMADAGAESPGASLPRRAQTASELTSYYRFVRNDRVTPDKTLEPHIERTVGRAQCAGRVLIIHDTTEFEFGGEQLREGLGVLSKEGRQGFLAHYSICATLEGEPLGTVGLRAWSRVGQAKGRARHTSHQAQYDPDREFLRWGEAALESGERLYGKADAVHVMDREGDSYELFAMLMEHGQSFVVRLQHNRRLRGGRAGETHKLFESLQDEPVALEREVPLSRRGSKGRRAEERKRFPPRRHRTARLEVRAATRSIFAGNVPPSLAVNVVEVREVDSPDGEEPVSWRLVTTLPIDTTAQIAAIVDSYCRRWLVEEFFKALKTGCRYQERQLSTVKHLLVSLALETAVAWHLLRLRWLAHNAPAAPASTVLSEDEVTVLGALSKLRKRPLPERPTVADVLFAIAALGGHLKSNGNPGWLVLRYGFEKLDTAMETWLAIRAAQAETSNCSRSDDVIED